MSTISDLATGLGKQVKDLSQLNVRTFSGDLNTILRAVKPIEGADPENQNEDQGVQDHLNNIDALLKKGFLQGDLKLEACTVMNLDGDIDQFYSTNVSPAFKALHESAVDTGKETRDGIVTFVQGLVK